MFQSFFVFVTDPAVAPVWHYIGTTGKLYEGGDYSHQDIIWSTLLSLEIEQSDGSKQSWPMSFDSFEEAANYTATHFPNHGFQVKLVQLFDL